MPEEGPLPDPKATSNVDPCAHAREDGNRRAFGLLGKPDCTAYEGIVAHPPMQTALPSASDARDARLLPAWRQGRWSQRREERRLSHGTVYGRGQAERRQVRMLAYGT
jgi:hypothetical protein